MNPFQTYILAKGSDELKKLITENPDLPIVVLVSDDAAMDCSWTFCSSVSCHLDEILDCDFLDYNDTVFTDRERLEEKIADDLWEEYRDKPEKEFDEAIKRELQKYEPYWKRVIAIYASN